MSNKGKARRGPSLITIFCAVRRGEGEIVFVDCNLPNYEGHRLVYGSLSRLAAVVAPNKPSSGGRKCGMDYLRQRLEDF